jgi:hypothetical protein
MKSLQSGLNVGRVVAILATATSIAGCDNGAAALFASSADASAPSVATTTGVTAADAGTTSVSKTLVAIKFGTATVSTTPGTAVSLLVNGTYSVVTTTYKTRGAGATKKTSLSVEDVTKLMSLSAPTGGSVATTTYVPPTSAGTYKVYAQAPSTSLRDSMMVTVTAPVVPPPTQTPTTPPPPPPVDTTTTTTPPPPTGSAVQPVITSLSRDAGSTAGGSRLMIFGQNFSSATVVRFGSATATVVSGSTTVLTVITPAYSVGKVSVTVDNSGLTATLPNAFEYLPAPTRMFAQSDFESGSLAPFETQGGVISGDVAASGTKSVKLSVTTESLSRILFTHMNNPALNEANGVYQRYRVLVPSATLVNAQNGQIKLNLFRNEYKLAFPAEKDFFMTGIGQEFSGQTIGQVGHWIDYGVQPVAPQTFGQLQGGVWAEIEVWYKRANGITQYKSWFNGRLSAQGSTPDMGSDRVDGAYTWYIGIVWQQGTTGPLTLYIDDVASANGFINN